MTTTTAGATAGVPDGSGYTYFHGRLGAVDGPPDRKALSRAAARHGLEVDPNSVPRLAQAHGLRIGWGT